MTTSCCLRSLISSTDMYKSFSCLVRDVSALILSYLEGGGGANYAPLVVFLHHPETPQAIKLKLTDFENTSLTHFQVIPARSLHSELLPRQQNNKGYLAEFDSVEKRKFLNNSVVYKDIELKFGMETNFGLLSSNNSIKLQLDVIMTS